MYPCSEKEKLLRTVVKNYRVDKKDIGYIRYIFEAYEGIAVVSTLSSEEGVVALRIAPGCEEEVEELVSHLGETIEMVGVKA